MFKKDVVKELQAKGDNILNVFEVAVRRYKEVNDSILSAVTSRTVDKAKLIEEIEQLNSSFNKNKRVSDKMLSFLED